MWTGGVCGVTVRVCVRGGGEQAVGNGARTGGGRGLNGRSRDTLQGVRLTVWQCDAVCRPSCQVLPLLQEQAVPEVAVLPWCAGL